MRLLIMIIIRWPQARTRPISRCCRTRCSPSLPSVLRLNRTSPIRSRRASVGLVVAMSVHHRRLRCNMVAAAPSVQTRATCSTQTLHPSNNSKNLTNSLFSRKDLPLTSKSTSAPKANWPLLHLREDSHTQMSSSKVSKVE